MKKIAIVGVDGSGKTVMMAAMGEQWERPDERGYFLSPENAEAFGFSKSVMAILRSGRWPNASSHDEMRTLEWSLQRRQGGNLEKIADISMLDYAGEVYRQAFGGEKREGYDAQVATLRSHVDEAAVLIVLVNLSDIISGSLSDRRTRDAMWLTKSVLDYALQGKSRKPHAAIVFTQADSYREIISANGGPAGALKKYLPHVANLYGELPIFTASAIDHTVIGTDGLPVPAPGFRSTGLKELMDWMIHKGEAGKEYECRLEEETERKRQEQQKGYPLITDYAPLVHLDIVGHKVKIRTKGFRRFKYWLFCLAALITGIVGIERCIHGFPWEDWVTLGGFSCFLTIGISLYNFMNMTKGFRTLRYFRDGRWTEALGQRLPSYDSDGLLLYYCAVCCLFGFGDVAVDHAKALRLFNQSAKNGVGEALVGLGWMAEKGLGMPQSLERAKQYYTEAKSMGANGVPEIDT